MNAAFFSTDACIKYFHCRFYYIDYIYIMKGRKVIRTRGRRRKKKRRPNTRGRKRRRRRPKTRGKKRKCRYKTRRRPIAGTRYEDFARWLERQRRRRREWWANCRQLKGVSWKNFICGADPNDVLEPPRSIQSEVSAQTDTEALPGQPPLGVHSFSAPLYLPDTRI